MGLVYDGGGELDQLMSTTAHELGHIFAMDHDDSENCDVTTASMYVYTPCFLAFFLLPTRTNATCYINRA